MLINNEIKEALFEDLNSSLNELDETLDISAGVVDVESLFEVFGENIESDIEEVAIKVMKCNVRVLLQLYSDGHDTLGNFSNSVPHGYIGGECMIALNSVFPEQTKAIMDDLQQSIFNILPEYVDKYYREIFASCNALEEYYEEKQQWDRKMDEQDRMDIANGVTPDRLFADKFDYGF